MYIDLIECFLFVDDCCISFFLSFSLCNVFVYRCDSHTCANFRLKMEANSISSLIQSANEYTKMWLQEDCISGQTSKYLTVIYVVEMQCDALCEQFADGVWVLKKAARQILKMCMERARKNAQASNRRESLVHLTLYSTLAILYLSFAISGIDVFVNDIIR